MAACHQVFSQPELAENIFIHLTAGEVLCNVQRTCREWKATVEWSNPISQALFIRPIYTESVVNDGSDTLYYMVDAMDDPIVVSAHPLIGRYVSQSSNRKGLCRPEASWRGQLVTQPPIKDPLINHEGSWDAQYGHFTPKPRRTESAVLRMGMLGVDENQLRNTHIFGMGAIVEIDTRQSLLQIRDSMLDGRKPKKWEPFVPESDTSESANAQ